MRNQNMVTKTMYLICEEKKNGVNFSRVKLLFGEKY